jgi:hypothetical protein
MLDSENSPTRTGVRSADDPAVSTAADIARLIDDISESVDPPVRC